VSVSHHKKRAGSVFATQPDTALKLTEWKKEPEKAFLSEVSSVVLQQSLRNLDTAFTNFFEKRAQYPKFKSRRHRQSVRYATNAFTFRDGRIILAKQSEPLDIVWSRPLPDDAKILNLTISRDTSRRYFVSILVETEIKPLRKTRAEVGIDVGIKTLATTSDGEKIENPRPLVKNEKRLRILQRRLSRKVKDSNNRTKARFRVARLHAKISDTRKNMLQQFTTKIIRENQAIFVEGLNVVGMLKHPNLAKHINATAFGGGRRSIACWLVRPVLIASPRTSLMRQRGRKSATLPARRPRGQGAEALELLCRYAWPGNAHRTHLTKPHF